MKTRNGFVSNSSSSSFLVFMIDDTMHEDMLIEKSLPVLKGYYSEIDIKDIEEDDPDYFIKQAKEYAEDHKYIILKERVEWGGEEAINTAIPKLLKALGIDDSKIEIGWDE